MDSPWRDIERLAEARLPEVLERALGLGEPIQLKPARLDRYDFIARTAGRTLLVEVKASPTPALLPQWEALRRTAKRAELPLLVVPYMTTSGRRFCQLHAIDWVDLCGNASIRAPGLHVRIEGRPDRYPRRGRPPSVFERRSSRLARVLLQQPGREWSVRECARASGLNEGHVSRIVARLVEGQLLRREGRRLTVTSAEMLLDAWREDADFFKHRILRGHVPARSGEELLALVSRRLSESHVGHAATGLGAAWHYDHFAMFRLATFYLRAWPTTAQLEALHFREEPQGANLWLALPTDDGVFEGSRDLEGIPCVHPVQVYVDLKDQPERAPEAAAHLKENPMLLGARDGAN